MLGFGFVQTSDPFFEIISIEFRRPVLFQVKTDPLLSSGNLQHLAIQIDIPIPVEIELFECGIKSKAMAILFRIGKGAVDIKQYSL